MLLILLNKIRRMRNRLASIDEPPSCTECLATVVVVAAYGGSKSVVKLTADTVDLLDHSGGVDPLPYLPHEARAVVLDTYRLFLDPLEACPLFWVSKVPSARSTSAW